VLCILAALTTARGRCTETAPSFIAKLVPEQPGRAVIAAASTNQVPLDGFSCLTNSTRLVAGDSITALATMHRRKASRLQWLIYLQVVAGTNPPPAGTNQSLTVYSSRGTRLEFPSRPVPANLCTLGPFADSGTGRKAPKAQDHRVAFSLDEGFLSVGLDSAAATLLRLRAITNKGSLWFGSAPPTAAKAAENRKATQWVGLSADEERSLAGAVPALLSFFNLAEHTEGLQDIVFKVVELPSVWSIAAHVGVKADLSMVSEEVRPASITGWGVPASTQAYYLPLALTLNGRPALKVTLIATRPAPPILPCGGVLGFVAERPTDPDTYLTLRVISARHPL
jgi:hypothetical protein